MTAFRLYSALFLFFLFFLRPGCDAAPYPSLKFDSINVEHGLSHGSVYSVAQDSTGFLWFGTGDGLDKYDGNTFTIYHHEPTNPNSLSSSNFGEVLEHSSGMMWFGTWGGGLTRLDPSTHAFTRFLHDPEDPSSVAGDRIEHLLEGSRGTLWIATETSGLDRYDSQSETFTHYRHDPADPRSLSDDRVKVIYEDRSGTLWVGTDDGLNRFDRATNGFLRYAHHPDDPRSLSSSRIRALVEDGAGALWVGTRGGGLNRLDPETGRCDRYRFDPGDPWSLSDDSVSALFVDSFGVLWIGTYTAGLNAFDPGNERFHSYTYDSRDPSSLSNNRVEVLYEDRTRNLWIGTRGGGVNKLDLKPAKFRTHVHDPNAPASLPHPSVRAIAGSATETGEVLWIGTDGGGISLFDSRNGIFHNYRHEPNRPNSLSSDRVWSILLDRQSTLWVGTYDAGLDRLLKKGEDLEFEHYRHDDRDPSSLSDDRVQTLFEDQDGDLWLGTPEGLNRAVPDSHGLGLGFEVYKVDPDQSGRLSSNYIITVYQDRSGMLWVGTRDGLYRFDKAEEVFRRVDLSLHKDSRGTKSILVIVEDKARAGTLWLGLEGGGLGRLESGTDTWTRYLVDDGLASNFVNGILQDDRGDLWISTSKGLSKFDPEVEAFKNYDQGADLENHGFNRNASLQLSNGRMYFGGTAGLTSFYPDIVEDNPFAPPVVLTSIKVFNEELELDRPLSLVEKIELSHRDNFLMFEFAALDYTSPAHNRYAYQLDRIDMDWVEAGTRRYASYANLAPGSYVFKVKAANSDGVWNEEGTSLRLVVTPPFWKRRWFHALLLVSLSTLVLSVHRVRMNAVTTRNDYLKQINERLHEEISERHRAESEKERLIAELQERNVEMEQFTYTVSHDLKSPIFTIKGFLGLLRKDAETGRADRMVQDIEQIESAADKMSQLLDELLDLSRIGRGANSGQETEMSLVAGEARDLVAGRIAEGNVEIEIAPNMPVVVGDRLRLGQVFQNLIENAVKFMGNQAEPRIEIGWEQRDGEPDPLFFVRDNGRGIPPEHQERVFQLFERIDNGDAGTGVGLAVVKRVIEVHGGRVWVESAGLGRGSTFYFSVPGTT